MLTPYPDKDWTYYVSAKPWPIPTGPPTPPAPPAPPPPPGPGNCFGRPAEDCFRLPNSLSFFVNMATAMASDTTLFKLGMVSLVTDPPLFQGNLSRFEQRLDMETASVTIGATLYGGRTLSAKVFVDANSNTITATLNSSIPLKLTVAVQSLHPDHPFAYYGRFGGPRPRCGPDVFESLPASAGRVVVSHRNEDSDSPRAFNYTLEQQGLGALVGRLQDSDRWRHRQFGMALSAVAGSGTTTALRRLNDSALQSAAAATSFELTVSTYAAQTPRRADWLQQLHRQHDRAEGRTSRGQPSQPGAVRLSAARRSRARAAASETRAADHDAWWQQFWARSHIVVSSSTSTEAATAAILTQKYAVCRYVQAIQSRTWVPVKFNGQMFTANLPPETASSGPSQRDWGADTWWQNTRLPYWNMAAAGDFDTFATIFEFYLQTLPFNSARTKAYFNHTGIFYTETKTLFGAFAVYDYGANASTRHSSLPPYLESNGYIHYDYGGNAGGTGVSMMILDHFLYTQNTTVLQRYFPIVSLTLDFFRQHHKNRTATGELVIWPTQALETYWCAWEPYFDAANNKSNCIVNDHPTVAALHVLLERVLRLPSSVGTAAQRVEWAAFQRILPPVPVTRENGFLSVSPYASYPINRGLHNHETPELYSVHPFRYYTLGRQQLGAKRSLEPALNCLVQGGKVRHTCANALGNGGWSQGVMNSALLGDAEHAKADVVGRAMTQPAAGYRFIGFAAGDYEPSADQFANMNTGLNWMLAQPADDADGSVIMFGAWPCSWDVDFKLAAPMATTVEGVFKDGKVQSLTVTPSSRRPYVHVNACQDV